MVRKFTIVLFSVVWTVILQAQPVIKLNDFSSGLQKQFNTALKQGSCTSNNFWIGYSIKRDDKRRVMIGSFYYNDKFKNVSLRDIITNTQKARDFESYISKEKKNSPSAVSYNINFGTSIKDKKAADKETAILFMYNKNAQDINDLKIIGICNLSYNFDLNGHPLIWLGVQDNKASVNFLISMFNKEVQLQSKKEMAAAIGVHTGQPEATDFLTKIVTSKDNTSVRADAAIWLGMQNNIKALNVLNLVIKSDNKLEVRKNAVWGIGSMELPEALDDIISIAKHNSNLELRKDAIFSLGNKAVKKAEEVLKDFIDDDPDIEIKKTAVYALAKNSGDSISLLIKIAKTNPNLEIRKCAIYSLSNSNDERALNALIELAKQ